jgi:hypothetical protein
MSSPRPKVGDSFRRRGQAYRCIGTDGYWNKRDYWVSTYTLRSLCAECGREFTTSATVTKIRRGLLSRRCEQHASPGKPVCPRRRRSRADKERREQTERVRREVAAYWAAVAADDEPPEQEAE